jgi:transposase-like protein
MARRRRRQFSPEFKAEAVRLVESSDAPLQAIAQQLGIGKGTLSRWVADGRAEPRPALSEDERSELVRLRREILHVKMERDIRKKATAFFARESE